MDYNALEIELVGKLNAYFSANELSPGIKLDTVFTARQMPENDDEFSRAADKAIINVHYSGSQYQPANGLKQIAQEEKVMIDCYIQARKLKGDTGANNLLMHLKKCLLGYRPTDASNRMQISSYGDWQKDGEGLMPFLQFSFDTMSVQEDDTPAPLGTLTQVTTIPAT